MLEGKYLLWEDSYDDVIKVRKRCINGSGKDMMDSEAIHAIVYEDKKPIACGRMLIQDDIYIFDHIYVIEEKRRNKIGDFILRLLIEKADIMCAKEIHVSCKEANEKFFKSVGFLEVKEPSNISVDYIKMHLDMKDYLSSKTCCK